MGCVKAPSVQHISSTQKGHSFSASKIPQFHTENPSVQHRKPLSSTQPSVPQQKPFSSTYPSISHQKPLSSTHPSVPLQKPLSSTPKTEKFWCWSEGFLMLKFSVWNFFGVELRGVLNWEVFDVELRNFGCWKGVVLVRKRFWTEGTQRISVLSALQVIGLRIVKVRLRMNVRVRFRLRFGVRGEVRMRVRARARFTFTVSVRVKGEM